MSALETILAITSVVGPIVGGLIGFKLKGKAPPSGDRLRR
jgi:hypothetical protein